ncbi:unnamed protein product [Phyllotreta striolata]|uniref:Uncharacterized protein n=1 Tax=Phyllotreta striolata TaxID=444603 RepID=A0A9N9TEW5_PHYSR|nr:unnamed protein product [Phyllotreta striolata]
MPVASLTSKVPFRPIKMKRCLVVICCYLSLFSEFGSDTAASIINIKHKNVCPVIKLKNGVAKRRTPRSRVVKYFCNRGYLLAGEKHSTCVRSAWDPPPPRCVRPTCRTIGKQLNSDNLVVYPTHSNAVQHFFCKLGYALNGPSVIYCDGTNWSSHVPTCLPTDAKPKLSCDFETADLCGWTHDLNHDFDWTRENFNTPSGSIGTGPSFDHTKGIGKNGYYMYIESSTRVENDTARLISPVYDKTDDDVCLEFFYHMFGSTIGTLRAYVKPVNDSWSLDPKSAIFSKSGNQGDKWYRSYHHLGVMKDEFQIIIEGVRGSNYISDIAIDDVKVILNCTDEGETTTVTMESATYNEVIPTVDTCENRCGKTEPSTNDNYHLTCDCDFDCVDAHRCCPDFFDACFGYLVSTTESTTFGNENTTSRVPLLETTTVSTKETTHPTRTKTTQTTTKPPSKPTQKHPRPVVYLQTPRPTTVIYRKILPTSKPPPSTKSSNEIGNGFDDAFDVPKPPNNDEGTYEVAEGVDDFLSSEIENTIEGNPLLTSFNESKLYSTTYVEEGKPNVLVIVISTMCIVVFVSVTTFGVLRRYRFNRGFMSYNRHGRGDEVRFVNTSDDLDFSLPDNYESM